MHNRAQQSSIDTWLTDVRSYFVTAAPELLWLFDIYAGEAIFGRRYIASDVANLKPGAKILEVGAGSLLLSCQLVREGFDVTGIEPVGSGFSHFEQMRQIVVARATALGCLPQILLMTAEAFAERDTFDYAFSVNVMEHVGEVDRVMANVCNSLLEGASYRFTCPNYLFPYEPHFNMPTLFSKWLTERLLSRQIFGCKHMNDPVGAWESLNWISVIQVRGIAKRLLGVKVTFNRSLLVATLERITFDQHFISRRSPWMGKIMSLLVSLHLHRLLRFVPAMLQPIIDCRLQKIGHSGWHQ
jgi:SAM-dependent methyltransferase